MLLVLSQRDIRHPAAGGAETYTHHALKALARQMEIVHMGLMSPGLPEEESIDGIRYVRRGSNLVQLTWIGFCYYRRHKNRVEAVIDHSNTHQFFTFLWARKKRIFFIHQLTQEIWVYFYGKLVGRMAWMMENALLRLSRGEAITVSESTRRDLWQKGFRSIRICQEGNRPVRFALPDGEKGRDLIYVGRLVPYKRVEDAICMAAALNKRLIVIGRGLPSYEAKLRRIAEKTGADCRFLGYLSREEKEAYMEQAELLVMPSVREGWGLVITEAANLGTPSMVYDVPGTAEAVQHGKAGFVAGPPCWTNLVKAYQAIGPERYQAARQEAFRYSLSLTWEATAEQFRRAVEQIRLKSGKAGEHGEPIEGGYSHHSL